MAIGRDGGHFSAKMGFTFGLEFPRDVDAALQREIADKMAALASELKAERERVEMQLLDFLCDKLGYTEDRVKALVETRTDEENDAIEQENAGRAEKNRRR